MGDFFFDSWVFFLSPFLILFGGRHFSETLERSIIRLIDDNRIWISIYLPQDSITSIDLYCYGPPDWQPVRNPCSFPIPCQVPPKDFSIPGLALVGACVGPFVDAIHNQALLSRLVSACFRLLCSSFAWRTCFDHQRVKPIWMPPKGISMDAHGCPLGMPPWDAQSVTLVCGLGISIRSTCGTEATRCCPWLWRYWVWDSPRRLCWCHHFWRLRTLCWDLCCLVYWKISLAQVGIQLSMVNGGQWWFN